MKEQSKLSLTIRYFLYFQIEMALTKPQSEMLAKRIVTFFKNESIEVLKHTVNHFKKENIPVRTIYNIITRYRKHNSTNYLPKTGRPKKISDQELKTLVRLIDNKVGVSQHRLGRRFGVNQSTISRNLKKNEHQFEFINEGQYRNTLVRINKSEQNPIVLNCTKKCLPIVNSFWTMRNISHLVVMFLEIIDIIHLILHQHQKISSLLRNKSSSHIYWYGLLSLHEGFPILTFIVQRLLYVKKFI